MKSIKNTYSTLVLGGFMVIAVCLLLKILLPYM